MMKAITTVKYQVFDEERLPRERLDEKGAEFVSDDELVAVLLGWGTRGSTVFEIAHEIVKVLDRSNNKPKLEDFLTIKGLGRSRALSLLACLELGRRVYIPRKQKICSPKDIFPLLVHYADREQECFIVFALNGANEVLSKEVVTMGLLNKTLVHPREVFKEAIRHSAASIIIAHNHPSGNLTPSDEDRGITEMLVKAGEVLDIEVLDHIVFSHKDFFSFLSHEIL